MKFMKFLKRIKLKRNGHKLHRVNGKFTKCNCLYVREIVKAKINAVVGKLSPQRIKATLD